MERTSELLIARQIVLRVMACEVSTSAVVAMHAGSITIIIV